jgi:phosphoserine phosphatase RsbU/P
MGERILVVEDTPANIQTLAGILKDQDYQISVATNGRQALEIIDRVRPDLILLDVMMPEMDGFETCQRLKSNPAWRDIPVIFLTAKTETADIVRGFELGAVDYVAKPFNAHELLARVRTHLQLLRLRIDLARKNEQLASANSRMMQELAAASRVQRALLPQSPLVCDQARLSWIYYPCTELGGDSLNFFLLDNRYLVMYILDVSGHGVQAALLSVAVTQMLMPRSDEHSLVCHDGMKQPVAPRQVAEELNRAFPPNTLTGRYFTLVYAMLDLAQGTFCYTSAGHPGPIHVSRNGDQRVCDSLGFPLGMFDEATYEEAVFPLSNGDRVIFYSDGLVEQVNAQQEQFTQDRFISAIRDVASLRVEDAAGQLAGRTLTWAGSDQPGDDLSVLVVEFR